jgi:hypothetical protein
MCLTVNNTEHSKFVSTFKDKPFVYCYKVVVLNINLVKENKKTLNSYFYGLKWQGGWNKARYLPFKYSTMEFLDYDTIHHGIHIYINECAAVHFINNESYYTNEKLIIIKVKCYKKDLITTGQNSDAVFTKVWLDKSEKQSVLRR